MTGVQTCALPISDMRSRSPCRTLLAQCFPTQANQINKDQLQLYYSNVNVIENGSRAEVQTSGTAVANRVKLVTLAQRSGVWRLTSYGKEKCRQAGRRR